MMNQTRFIYFFLVSWLFVLGCFSTGDDEVVPKTKQQLFGTLRSPNYPYVYPNFLQRTWHLQVPNGYRVQIKFLHFDLEPSHLCEYDAIELLDGQHILGTFCGKYDTDTERVPGSQPILAPGNILTIKFRSDYSNEEDFTGFVALYTAVDIDECVEFANDEERSCDHFCQNYPGGFFCSCRHGYHLHDNNRTCTVHCNNIIYNGRQGEIFSPEYPHPYPGELHCHVRIVLPEGLHPSIHFEDTFNVENHPEIDGCPFDSLTIRSGGELFGPFCGTHPPKDIQALSNEVDIEFHTDSSGQHNGWAFSYMAKGKACPMPLAPLNGSLFPHQENYFFTDQLIFTCNSGFELVKESGEKVRTLQLECQSSGTWSSLFPTCQPLDCGPPPPLENGRYDGDNSTTFLSSVTYSCNTPYYYLRSQANATQYVCNEMSKWISAEGQKELPSCMPACGRPLRSLHNIQKRIVDGRAADPGAFPWQALILARERPNGEQRFGGGAILTSRWLLTASHLLLPRQKQFGPQKPLPPSGLDVFVGLHEIRKRSEAVRPVVESVHLHMGFNHRSYDNDIALLRLKTPIPFGSTIMPVCLPFGNKPSHVDITVFSTASFVNTTVTTMVPKSSQTKSHPSLNFTSLMNNNILNDHEENDTDYEGPSTQQELSDELSPGDMGVVSGWGSTWATLNSSRITSRTEFLQYVNLPVVNQSTCRAGYRKNGRRSYRLTKNMFCAGYAHGGPDTCLGDSGGAYVTQTTGSDGLPQWVVQGLVSWGWPGECGRKGVFGVYSRVANYISWIKEQIQPFGDVDSLPYNDPS